MKRHITELESNGYKVKIVSLLNCECETESLKCELEDSNINWFNFNDGDSYYSDSDKEYIVLVDHDTKIVKLVRA